MFKAYGLGFGVLVFRNSGLCLGFSVQDLGFGVWGLRFGTRI